MGDKVANAQKRIESPEQLEKRIQNDLSYITTLYNESKLGRGTPSEKIKKIEGARGVILSSLKEERYKERWERAWEFAASDEMKERFSGAPAEIIKAVTKEAIEAASAKKKAPKTEIESGEETFALPGYRIAFPKLSDKEINNSILKALSEIGDSSSKTPAGKSQIELSERKYIEKAKGAFAKYGIEAQQSDIDPRVFAVLNVNLEPKKIKKQKVVEEKTAKGGWDVEGLKSKISYNGKTYNELFKAETLTKEESEYFEAAKELLTFLRTSHEAHVQTVRGKLPDTYGRAYEDIRKALEEQNKKLIVVTRPISREAQGEYKTVSEITFYKETRDLQKLMNTFQSLAKEYIETPSLDPTPLVRLYKSLTDSKTDITKLNVDWPELIAQNKELLTKMNALVKKFAKDATEENKERVTAIFNFVAGRHTGEIMRITHESLTGEKGDPTSEYYASQFNRAYDDYRNGSDYYRFGANSIIKDIDGIGQTVKTITEIRAGLATLSLIAGANPLPGKDYQKEFDNLVRNLKAKDAAIVDAIIAIQRNEGITSLDALAAKYKEFMEDTGFRAAREALLKTIRDEERGLFVKFDLTVQYALVKEDGKWVNDRVREYRAGGSKFEDVIHGVSKVDDAAQLSFIRNTLPLVLRYAPAGTTSEIIGGKQTFVSDFADWMSVVVNGQAGLRKEYNLKRSAEDLRMFYQSLPTYLNKHLSDEVEKKITQWQGQKQREFMNVTRRFAEVFNNLGHIPLPVNAIDTEFGKIDVDKLSSYETAARAIEIFTPYLTRTEPSIWIDMYRKYSLQEAVNDAVAYVNIQRQITTPDFKAYRASIREGTDVPTNIKLAASGAQEAISLDADVEKNPRIVLDAYNTWYVNKARFRSAGGTKEDRDAYIDTLFKGPKNQRDNLVSFYNQQGNDLVTNTYLRTPKGVYEISRRNVSSEEASVYWARAKGASAEGRIAYNEDKSKAGFVLGAWLKPEYAFVGETTPDGDYAVAGIRDTLRKYNDGGGTRVVAEIRKSGAYKEAGGTIDTEKLGAELYADVKDKLTGVTGALKYVDGKDFSLELRGYDDVELERFGSRMKAKYGKEMGDKLYGWTIAQVLKTEGYDISAVQELRFKGNELQLGWTPEAKLARFLKDSFTAGFTDRKTGQSIQSIFDLVERYYGAPGVAAMTERVPGEEKPATGGKAVIPFADHKMHLVAALTRYWKDRTGYSLLIGTHIMPLSMTPGILMYGKKQLEENPEKVMSWNAGAFWRLWETGGIYGVYDEENRVQLMDNKTILNRARFKGAANYMWRLDPMGSTTIDFRFEGTRDIQKEELTVSGSAVYNMKRPWGELQLDLTGSLAGKKGSGQFSVYVMKKF